MEERLQKVMARVGIASRRASEELIRGGRVMVNGQVVTEMGTKVDPQKDTIIVDGELLPVGVGRQYIKLNKPIGVISTADDPFGRRTVLDLVDSDARLYPVGRLDADSEGLMLLTNDGGLTERLTHPRFGLVKTYLVLIQGEPREQALRQLTQGVELEDGPAHAVEVRPVAGTPRSARGMSLSTPAGMHWLEVDMLEGRKREVRRLFEQIGHPVQRLVRIRMGTLELGDLRPGETRKLLPVELRDLLAGAAPPRRRQGGRPASRHGRPAGPVGGPPKKRRGPPAPKGKGVRRPDEERSGSGASRPRTGGTRKSR